MARASYKDWITEDGLAKLEHWSRNGLTNEQIANNIGIARQTLYTWIKKYSDINDALKKGVVNLNIQLENAIIKSATGFFETEEETTTTTTEEVTDSGKKVVLEVTKTRTYKRYYKPEVGAQIFLLKNRMPEFYKDKPEAKKNEGGLVQIVDDI